MTCSVEDCDRQVDCRGLCKMHWKRWRKHGDPTIVLPRGRFHDPSTVRPCSIDGCDRPHFARGWCEPHYRRWGHTGSPLGREPGYSGVHYRLRKVRGNATAQSCINCGGRAQQWAYDHTQTDPMQRVDAASGRLFSLDLMRYLPMCPPCHKLFDLNT